MNTYLVIDTETSSLFDFSKPANAPGQPRLAHLAMIWLNADLFQERAVDYYIKPDGWVIEDGAAKVNGLTQEMLHEKGIPVAQALSLYEQAIREGRIVVAFNAQFDTKIMRAELRRDGRDDLFEQTPNICTMRELVGVCKLPKANGKGYKFPKLTEACAHFRIPYSDAHTATADALACAELLRKLRWLKLMPEPKVHFAKNRPLPIEPAMPLKEALEKSVGDIAAKKAGYDLREQAGAYPEMVGVKPSNQDDF